MKLLFKLAGFVIIISVIFLVLQLTSEYTKKGKVSVGAGIRFEPAETEGKTSKSGTEIQKPAPPPVKNENTETPEKNAHSDKTDNTKKEINLKPEKNIPDLPEKKQEFSAEKDVTNKAEASAKDTGAKPETVLAHNQIKPSVKENLKPEVVKLSDEVFVEIDRSRDLIDNSAVSKKNDDIYGWGLVDKYEEPDLAVRTLGGIPFAIDKKGPYYYRIFPASQKVKPASMVSSAYSTVGIEAHDKKLRSLVKEAFRSGKVSSSPDLMSYYYLFTTGTERYILSKVVNTFEWFMKKQGYDADKTEDFKKTARLRLDVWQAMRNGGGEMGIAIPIYFDYNGQKLFLPQDYYVNDSETIKIGLDIDTEIY